MNLNLEKIPVLEQITKEEFVENYFLAKDSRALREYIKEIQPDVDLTFFPDNGSDRTSIPIGVSFFWPDI